MFLKGLLKQEIQRILYMTVSWSWATCLLQEARSFQSTNGLVLFGNVYYWHNFHFATFHPTHPLPSFSPEGVKFCNHFPDGACWFPRVMHKTEHSRLYESTQRQALCHHQKWESLCREQNQRFVLGGTVILCLVDLLCGLFQSSLLALILLFYIVNKVFLKLCCHFCIHYVPKYDQRR